MFQDLKIYNTKYPNGFALSEMGAILTRESSMDLFPSRELHTASVLGRPGSLQTREVIQPRNINLVVHFSVAELEISNPFRLYTLDELDNFLTQLFVNNYSAYEVEFTDMPGRFYPVVWDNSRAPRFLIADGIVSYTLIGYDPYIYGDKIERLATIANTALLQQFGTEVCEPVFRVKASELGRFELSINGNITVYTLNPSYNVSNTGYVTLDVRTRTLINEVGQNLLPQYPGGFPTFPANSIVLISPLSGTTEVLVSYRSRSLY